MSVAASVNLQTTNPEQLNDRVTAMQIALALDELMNLQLPSTPSTPRLRLFSAASLC